MFLSLSQRESLKQERIKQNELRRKQLPKARERSSYLLEKKNNGS
jgi:hypothetical protein